MNSLYSQELAVFVKVYTLELIVLVREHLELRNGIFDYSCIRQNLFMWVRGFTYLLTGSELARHVGGIGRFCKSSVHYERTSRCDELGMASSSCEM